MIGFIKKIILRVCFGNPLTRRGIHFPKGSYIREHASLKGGKYIHLGKNCRIYQYARIMCFDRISGETLHPNLTIGNHVLIGRNTTILCADKIVIGDDCCIASYCFFSDENHGTDPSLGVRYECQKLERKPVCIGRNVWIGEKVIVLPGVTVGDNAVIGAGSVVTKDIPANSVAVGNPARVIKQYCFETKQWKKV